MLADLAITIVNLILRDFLRLRPVLAVHLPSGVATAIAVARAYDAIYPISEIMTCAGIICMAFIAMNMFKWLKYLIDVIGAYLPTGG